MFVLIAPVKLDLSDICEAIRKTLKRTAPVVFMTEENMVMVINNPEIIVLDLVSADTSLNRDVDSDLPLLREVCQSTLPAHRYYRISQAEEWRDANELTRKLSAMVTINNIVNKPVKGVEEKKHLPLESVSQGGLLW